jgi:hypothetical protein
MMSRRESNQAYDLKGEVSDIEQPYQRAPSQIAQVIGITVTEN